MSSDNGVYILKTQHPSGEGFEYRVAHAQGIDNLYYDLEVDDYAGIDSPYSQDFFDFPANEFFGGCEVYTDEARAWNAAWAEAGDHSILEYGVSMQEHPNQVFKYMTEEEMVAEEARIDAVLEGHRARRQEELDELWQRQEEAAMHIDGPMEVSNLWGFFLTSDGRRVRGNVLGNCVVTFPEPVKFLPADWDKERKES